MGVQVAVGVWVGVPVEVEVGVEVGVFVEVEVRVGVPVGVREAVGVAVLLGVNVGVRVEVAIGVEVVVAVGVWVGVPVIVGVGVKLLVGKTCTTVTGPGAVTVGVRFFPQAKGKSAAPARARITKTFFIPYFPFPDSLTLIRGRTSSPRPASRCIHPRKPHRACCR